MHAPTASAEAERAIPRIAANDLLSFIAGSFAFRLDFSLPENRRSVKRLPKNNENFFRNFDFKGKNTTSFEAKQGF